MRFLKITGPDGPTARDIEKVFGGDFEIEEYTDVVEELASDILHEEKWSCNMCSRTPNKLQCDGTMCIEEIIKKAEIEARYD